MKWITNFVDFILKGTNIMNDVADISATLDSALSCLDAIEKDVTEIKTRIDGLIEAGTPVPAEDLSGIKAKADAVLAKLKSTKDETNDLDGVDDSNLYEDNDKEGDTNDTPPYGKE